MSEESARLRIPYIAASQAQKHVTHNEAMTLLDTLCQASVIDKDLSTPPGSPAEGDCYIVAPTGTGAWIGWDNRIVRYIDGQWRSYLPGAGSGEGWLVYVQDEEAIYVFSGGAWQAAFARASTTELLTGTDAAKLVTPDAFAALWEKGADVASASTISLGEGGYFHVTGTTTITDIDFATAKDGRVAILEFDGALTLTHHATTLKLPGGANIVTAAGDVAILVQDASDNVRVVSYVRASGKPVGATGTLIDNGAMRADGTAGNIQGSGLVITDTDQLLRGVTAAVTGFGGSQTNTPVLQLHALDGNQGSLAGARYTNNNLGPRWFMAKSRGGSIGSYTVVQANDLLGEIRFLGSDGTVFRDGAFISAYVDGTPGSDDMPGRLVVSTAADGSSAPTERFHIDSNGHLEYAPSTLVVVDGANGHLGLRSYTVGTLPSASTAARLIYVSDGASNKRLAVSDGSNWRFPDGNVVS